MKTRDTALLIPICVYFLIALLFHPFDTIPLTSLVIGITAHYIGLKKAVATRFILSSITIATEYDKVLALYSLGGISYGCILALTIYGTHFIYTWIGYSISKKWVKL